MDKEKLEQLNKELEDKLILCSKRDSDCEIGGCAKCGFSSDKNRRYCDGLIFEAYKLQSKLIQELKAEIAGLKGQIEGYKRFIQDNISPKENKNDTTTDNRVQK